MTKFFEVTCNNIHVSNFPMEERFTNNMLDTQFTEKFIKFLVHNIFLKVFNENLCPKQFPMYLNLFTPK